MLGVFVSRHKFYVCNFRTKHKICILAYHNLCLCVFVFLGMLQSLPSVGNFNCFLVENFFQASEIFLYCSYAISCTVINARCPPCSPVRQPGIINGNNDDVEWLGMDVHKVIDLRAVLQAEQVVILLLDMWEWAKGDGIQWHAPGLAGAVRRITERDDDDDDNDVGRKEDGDDSREEGGRGLVDIHRTLGAAVKIVRPGPNLMDPYLTLVRVPTHLGERGVPRAGRATEKRGAHDD